MNRDVAMVMRSMHVPRVFDLPMDMIILFSGFFQISPASFNGFPEFNFVTFTYDEIYNGSNYSRSLLTLLRTCSFINIHKLGSIAL